MAEYQGFIPNKSILGSKRLVNLSGDTRHKDNAFILKSERITNINGNIVSSGNILNGKVTRIRKGMDTKTFKFQVFERIPKERILNKFSSLEENVKF